MSDRRIIEAFEAWATEGRKLVLGTVYETQGSTYSKAGQHIIIADNGDYQGLVSGGCLEGDLAEHAAQVIADGQARSLTYDLRDEADEVWGLGIGCNGLLRILLQRLEPDNNYQPFRAITELQRRGESGIAAVIVASDDPQLEIGASLLKTERETKTWRMPEEQAAEVLKHCDQLAVNDPNAFKQLLGSYEALCASVRPLPQLLILGAGPDALPVLRIAHELGWLVTLADHRPAYLGNPEFGLADTQVESLPEQIASQVNLDDYNAAIVMSHHLDSDRSYLHQLAACRIPYIGLLGPRLRRERLIKELGQQGARIAPRLHGPIGLDIGADSPESIALAILAEIHKTLANGGRTDLFG